MTRDSGSDTPAADEATRTSKKPGRNAGAAAGLELALAVIHAHDYERVGDVVFLPPDGSAVLGRGASEAHLLPVRQRPGATSTRAPFDIPFLSRDQLRITRPSERVLRVENIGKCPLLDVDEREVDGLDVRPGDAFALGDHLAFVCVERPRTMPRLRASEATRAPFGEADAEGIVGESATAWELRDTLAFVAARSAHVLVLGPSGSGKEIAAQAIHRLSPRRSRAIVARNASTLPSGLIDAELFGTAANYPNQGMPERPGLVGEANGSTLFLDEIGDLPEALSTRLLRLLDEHGDYQRLGDARRRSADVRVIGATNRPTSSLRADVAARFKLRITLPGLGARREDIPLLVRHLMQSIATEDGEIASRFFHEGRAVAAKLRVAPALLLRLVTHAYTTHVRELEALLWLALASSKGDMLAWTPELAAELADASSASRATEAKGPPTLDEIRAALSRVGGVQEKAWRELGLANRYVLKRLVKKYKLTT